MGGWQCCNLFSASFSSQYYTFTNLPHPIYLYLVKLVLSVVINFYWKKCECVSVLERIVIHEKNEPNTMVVEAMRMRVVVRIVVRLNYWLYAIDYLVPKYLKELFVPTLVCLWDAVAAIHLGKDNLFFPTVL